MTRPSEALRDLQRALFVLGFDPGPPDGLWGPRMDAVTVARIATSRLIACRWPATWPAPTPHLPRVERGARPLSVNEAGGELPC
jgi:hypothetical protein